MINIKYPSYSCNICGAVFQVFTNDKFNLQDTIDQCNAHILKCTTQNKYLNDANAVIYPPS